MTLFGPTYPVPTLSPCCCPFLNPLLLNSQMSQVAVCTIQEPSSVSPQNLGFTHRDSMFLYAMLLFLCFTQSS